ncbi:protein RALF-like 22 [Rhododendron vialii]|uniref:protein RALF-like 22 n=1 Tax=Rhododendron vialii TaxID=182163 RepID=UPI002660522E|nr:protein RALF-like 22 [Rhododendron vialii]
MALVRGGLFLLLLSLAAVAESSFSFNEASLESAAHFDIDALRSRHVSTCNGQVGDCIDVEEEMMMGSEGARRVLARQRYISYGALRANNVPCTKRGRSYYNCNTRGRANPYSRGCSRITRCARG